MNSIEIDFTKTVLYAVFVYLGISAEIVMILFIMMTLDSGLGIAKALRLDQKFSFKILLWGMVGKLSILIIPLIVALIGKAVSFDFKYFVVAVMDIIVVSEAISCITNIISIKTKKPLENTDYITMLLNTIRRSLMSIIQKLLSTIEQAKTESLTVTKNEN